MRMQSLSILVIAGVPAASFAAIPQLEQTQWFASQLFWLAITFALMFALVRGFITPTIAGVLKAREEAIHEAACDAERVRMQAEQARNSSDTAIAEARSKAASLLGEAKAKANDKAAKHGRELDVEIDAQLSKAEAQVTAAKAEALKSLEAEAQALAEAMRDTLIDANGKASLKAAS